MHLGLVWLDIVKCSIPLRVVLGKRNCKLVCLFLGELENKCKGLGSHPSDREHIEKTCGEGTVILFELCLQGSTSFLDYGLNFMGILHECFRADSITFSPVKILVVCCHSAYWTNFTLPCSLLKLIHHNELIVALDPALHLKQVNRVIDTLDILQGDAINLWGYDNDSDVEVILVYFKIIWLVLAFQPERFD